MVRRYRADMEAPQNGDSRMSADTDTNISHFIHAVELKGSRAQKLQTLDTLIAYLEELRRSLAEDPSGHDGPGPRSTTSLRTLDRLLTWAGRRLES